MKLMLMLALVFALGLELASAQIAPQPFKVDTPPVPGQIQESPRDQLGIGRDQIRKSDLGLSTSGPKGSGTPVSIEKRRTPEI
jgi:hypothetical protein